MARPKKDKTKEIILEYLEKNSALLKEKYSLIDIRFEENPSRLVLTSRKELQPETIQYKDVVIPTEVEILDIKSVVVPAQENDEKFHTEFTKEAQKVLQLKETIGPHSVVNSKHAEDIKKKYKI